MYPISALYDQYLRKPDREFILKAEINGVEYDNASIVDFEIENSLTIDDEFQIGTTTLSKLTLRLRTPEDVPQGSKIKPYITLGAEGLSWDEAAYAWQDFNVQWGNGQAEWLPLGEFYVDQREQINNVWTLVCYDVLVFADEAYLSSLSYPASMQAVWDEICTALGYSYDGTVVINPSYMVQAAPVGYTKREVMGYIASANSASVFSGKDGKIKFKRWSAAATPVSTFTTADYVRVKQTNPIKTYTRVVMPYDPDDADAYYEAGTGDDGHTLYVGNPFATQAICDALYASLNGFIYMPIQMDARGYPQYEHGDIIGFQKQEGTTWAETIVAWQDANFTWDNIVTYKTIMLHTVLTYRGGLKMTVEAQAKSAQASEYEQDGPLTKEINRVNQTAVKQGKLYYGVSITKEDGLIVERSDHLSKVVLNSDEFTMWAESEKALWFDVPSRKFKFAGDLEAAGGTFSGALQAASGTFEGIVQGGSFLGGNIEIGSGNDVFKANSSGMWLGHSSFGSAPFSVDMTGHMYAFNAYFQGTIEASSIIGGTVTGTTVQTKQPGNYPRAFFDSTGSYFGVETGSGTFVDMIPGLFTEPAFRFYSSGTIRMVIGNILGGPRVHGYESLYLDSDQDVFISSGSGFLTKIDSWSKFYSIAEGQTFATALSSKANMSSFSGTFYVANSSGGTATRAITVVNGVIQ